MKESLTFCSKLSCFLHMPCIIKLIIMLRINITKPRRVVASSVGNIKDMFPRAKATISVGIKIGPNAKIIPIFSQYGLVFQFIYLSLQQFK